MLRGKPAQYFTQCSGTDQVIIITAALYIMLQIELLALAQIMLYIGGIVVFMLLIILLTTGLGVDNKLSKVNIGKWLGNGLITGALFTGLLYFSQKTAQTCRTQQPQRRH